MATVHSSGPQNFITLDNVKPEVGKMYLWYQHHRSLLALTILDVQPDAIKMKWQVYLKLMGENDPHDGEVIWNDKEWEVADLKEFIYPVTKESLAEDEELCRTCSGMYFYFERDHDICGCLWCNNSGKVKKIPPSPQPTQRSGLHPVVPPQN